jgi:hypothetical protein
VPSLALLASPMLTQVQFEARQRSPQAFLASRVIPEQATELQVRQQQQQPGAVDRSLPAAAGADHGGSQIALTSTGSERNTRSVVDSSPVGSSTTVHSSTGADSSTSSPSPVLPLGPMELSQLAWSLSTAGPLGLKPSPGFAEAFCTRVGGKMGH